MKKIGLLFGIEQTFAQSVIDCINNRNISNVTAGSLKVGALGIADEIKYNVIFDRVSNEVPFYRSILKLAAMNGTMVVNSPFTDCMDDKFILNSFISNLGINVPKTVVLPSKEHPPGTNSDTMRNLEYPIDWDKVFYYVGFPSYIKPNHRNSFQSIEYDEYYRCFVVGDAAKVMFYNPDKPLNQRYISGEWLINTDIENKILSSAFKISEALNLDFNVIDFAVRDSEIFAVELFNPMVNSEYDILHNENFNWLVDKTADLLIAKASEKKKSKEITAISDLFRVNESKPSLIQKPSGKKPGRPKAK
ncbi:MAG: hypothetical protein HZB41_00975 [Ignavibacteriae bacterium]|nr:hypothetical protein [Ignavibacteriota bacterium]